jgi:hypothetical protein
VALEVQGPTTKKQRTNTPKDKETLSNMEKEKDSTSQ